VYSEEEAEHMTFQWFTDYMLTHLKIASSNMGFGPAIPNPVPQATGLDGQWFLTDQNSLDLVIYRRMLDPQCLVSNYTEADLIYVPYFGGLDMLRNMHEEVEKRDSLGKELLSIVTAHPAWKRNNGSDHFIVLGATCGTSHARRTGTGGPLCCARRGSRITCGPQWWRRPSGSTA